jgi:hypothetical protein
MKAVIGTMLVLLFLLTPAGAISQFKSQAGQSSASESMIRPLSSINSFLGLLNPDNFSMHHNFSYSYLSGGGTGLSVASYTNTMFYKFSDPLNVRFDLTMQGTPFGAASAYQNSINGIFLSRAELNYRPWQDVFIRLEYNHLPAGFSHSLFDPWYYGYPAAADELNR